MNCIHCNEKLNNSNWTKTKKHKHDYRCKKCVKEYDKKYRAINKEKINLKQKTNRRKNFINTTDENGNNITIKCKKRQHSLTCELCNKKVNTTVYHHWNDLIPEQGIWVCRRCHQLCECTDDNITSDMYLKLKEIIINI